MSELSAGEAPNPVDRYLRDWITNLERNLAALRPGSLSHEDVEADIDALTRALALIDQQAKALEAARAELVEKWLTRADKIDAENRPTDSNETRLVAITTAGTLRDCAKALSARVDAALEGSKQ